MSNKSPDGWQRLTCSCGTERFATVVHLRWGAGKGMSQEPAGYFCLECHATVDSAALIAKAQHAIKQQELRDLEAEMADGPKPVAMPAAAAGKAKA